MLLVAGKRESYGKYTNWMRLFCQKSAIDFMALEIYNSFIKHGSVNIVIFTQCPERSIYKILKFYILKQKYFPPGTI